MYHQQHDLTNTMLWGQTSSRILAHVSTKQLSIDTRCHIETLRRKDSCCATASPSAMRSNHQEMDMLVEPWVIKERIQVIYRLTRKAINLQSMSDTFEVDDSE